MKKIVVKLLAVLLVAASVLPMATACTPRDQVLKILNWGDYMDDDVWRVEFPAYYKALTGKNIRVQYSPDADNERMYTMLRSGGRNVDYDVIAPSEYMLQRMMREGMLERLSRDENGNYTVVEGFDGVFDELRGMTYEYNGSTFNYDDFAVPYMWGTVGILYNVNRVQRHEVETWDAFLNPTGAHAGRVTMKDSIRDAYFVGAVQAYNQANGGALLDMFGKEGHAELLQSVVDDTSPEMVAAVQSVLSAQRAGLHGYETDEGKGEMVRGDLHMGLMWSGDAIWAFDEDMSSNEATANLAYYVPHTGSNRWTDYFVIPKKAGNKTAAEIFLNFILDKDVAMSNMAATGYTSAVEQACVEYRQYLEESDMWEDSKITARGEEWAAWYRDMYLDTMFPTDEVWARTAMMNDFGDRNAAINNMWMDVRI